MSKKEIEKYKDEGIKGAKATLDGEVKLDETTPEPGAVIKNKEAEQFLAHKNEDKKNKGSCTMMLDSCAIL